MSSKLRMDSDGSIKDIISGLPRHLIDNILERLSLCDVVRTSILSRHWRYIWTMHPQLVLDKQFLEKISKRNGYASMITNILLVHYGPVLKCTLYIPNIAKERIEVVDQWILVLWRKNVKELIITNSNSYPYLMPAYIFACSELTHLKLHHCLLKPPYAFRGFDSLKWLYLDKITFPAPLSGSLVLDFPLLESLTFKACIGIDHVDFHAPNLKNFFLIDSHQSKWLCFQEKTNITAVQIELHKHVVSQGRTIELIQLFDNIPRVSQLLFDGFFLKFLALGIVPQTLPAKLNHLKHLVLESLYFNDLDQILCTLCLLRSSPNLETCAFTIKTGTLEPVYTSLEEPIWSNLKLEQLKCVVVRLGMGLVPELRLIETLLSCSPVLERMFIVEHQPLVPDEALRISKAVLRFPRASSKAEIIYEGHRSPKAVLVPFFFCPI